MKTLWGLCLLLVCLSARGAEMLASDVRHQDGRFTLHSEIRVDLPESEVRAILTDYARLPQINSGIKEVEILDRQQGLTRLRLAARVCILIFCQHYRWTQEALVQADGDIVATIDPRDSDFREGRARWRLVPEGQGTRMVFDAVLVPDFWFPPLVGPWAIKRKLHGEALEAAQGVERLANEVSASR